MALGNCDNYWVSPRKISGRPGGFVSVNDRVRAAPLNKVGLAELTKQHGHELAPAGEPAQVAVGLMLAYGLLECQARKQLQKLGEDATETLHG